MFHCLEWRPEGSKAAGSARLVCCRWHRTLTAERQSLFPRSRQHAMPRDWAARFPALRAVDMRRCTNTRDSWMAALARLPLTELNLAGSECLTAHGLSALLPLERSLTSLDVTDCHRVDDGALGALLQLSALRSLSIAGCRNVTDDGVSRLSALSSLRALDASRCRKLTDATPAALSGLTRLAALRLAYVSRVSDAGLWHLRALSSLRELSLSGCTSISRDGLACLPASLETLLLRGCPKVDDCCLSNPTVIAAAGRITALELSGDPVTAAGLHALSQRFTRLTDLALMQCASVSDSGLRSLQLLPSKLTALSIAYCSCVTAEGLASVLDAHGPELLRLSIRGCAQLGDAAMGVVCAHATRLTELDISSLSDVSDRGAAQLANLRQLRKLSMQYCQGVGDDAVKGLLAVLPDLEWLNADRLCDNNLRKATGDRPQLRPR